MENAAKALEIAGAVLIALLVLGLAVFAYNNISETKRIEEASLAEQQATDANKDFEAYNKDGVYGSEVLSLANKIKDYNSKEVSKGYKEITLEVTITTQIIDAKYFKSLQYDENTLTINYDKLAEDTKNANNITAKNKKISYWANVSDSVLKANFNDGTSPTLNKMKEDINNYKKLVSEQTDFARKTFNCTDVKYDNGNGRITKMVFEEE